MPAEMGEVWSAINSAVSPLKSSLHQHQQALREHAAQLNAIEAEMVSVERAVIHMGATLANKLDHLGSGQRELVDVQQSTMRMTLEQFTAANSQLGGLRSVSEIGFQGVSSTLSVVDGSVKQMSAAVVQMEVIRLLNEAKGPVRQIVRFQEEIDQRFAKAVENVYFVRCQYDQVLGGVMGEYHKKLRTIGEHIYRIQNEDFRVFAEEPLSTTSEVFATLPLAVEDRRIEARRDALETDLEELGAESLQPLLEMHRQFEDAMASSYGADVQLAADEVNVPAAIRIVEGAAGVDVEAFVGAAMRRGQTSAELRPVIEGAAELSQAVAAAARTHLDRIQTKPMAASDLGAMKESLSALAKEGVFEPALLPGYFEYLDTFGLDEVAEGEISLDRGAQ